MVKKIYLGAMLILAILSASFYLVMEENVRIDFSETKTTFSIWENEKFVTSGTEYTRIFDGSTLMRAKERSLNYSILDNITQVKRVATFKDNILAVDTYLFENNVKDVRDVPVSHEICFYNASGKIFEYLIQDIEYSGETKEITSPFSFGKKMTVEFQEGSYSAKVVNNKIASDKVIIRYKITKDECFEIRLFDPPLNTTNRVYQTVELRDGYANYYPLINLTNPDTHKITNVTIVGDNSKISISPNFIPVMNGSATRLFIFNYSTTGDKALDSTEYQFNVSSVSGYSGTIIVQVNVTDGGRVHLIDYFNRVNCLNTCWGGSPDIGGTYKFIRNGTNKDWALVSKLGTLNASGNITDYPYVFSTLNGTVNPWGILEFRFNYTHKGKGGIVELTDGENSSVFKFNSLLYYDDTLITNFTTNSQVKMLMNYYHNNTEIYIDDVIFYNKTQEVFIPKEVRFGFNDTTNFFGEVKDLYIVSYGDKRYSNDITGKTYVLYDDFADGVINTTLYKTANEGETLEETGGYLHQYSIQTGSGENVQHDVIVAFNTSFLNLSRGDIFNTSRIDMYVSKTGTGEAGACILITNTTGKNRMIANVGKASAEGITVRGNCDAATFTLNETNVLIYYNSTETKVYYQSTQNTTNKNVSSLNPATSDLWLVILATARSSATRNKIGETKLYDYYIDQNIIPANLTTNNTISWNYTANNITWEEFDYTLPGWFSYYWTEYNVTHSGKYSILNTGGATNVKVNFDLDKGTGYTFYMKRNSGNWTALANISSMLVGTNQTQNLTFKFDVQNQLVRWYATSSGYSNMTGDYNLTITTEES